MFLRAIKRRLHCLKEREIPLERLARLWLEDSGLANDKEGSKEVHMTWAHEEINSFYSGCVESFLPRTDPARPVIAQILTILDEQGDCPSAITGEKDEEVFSEISLREYSLEVARIAFDIVKRGHRDPEMLMGKILIISVGHQLGVISKANILGGVSAKSILMLDPMIRDLPYKESIIPAIRTFRGNNPKTPESKILRAASSAARKKEYERARVFSMAWHKPSPSIDIEEIKSAIQETGSDREA